MSTIGPGHQVYFLTARVPRPWESEVNTTLHNGAKRWKNVHVLEWRVVAGCHDDWFVNDGFHLRTPGQHAYADFVRLGLLGRARSARSSRGLGPRSSAVEHPVDELQEPVAEIDRQRGTEQLEMPRNGRRGSSAGRVIPGMRPRSTTLPHFGQVASGLTVEGVRNLLQLDTPGHRSPLEHLAHIAS